MHVSITVTIYGSFTEPYMLLITFLSFSPAKPI